jgi:hypothetical protein
MSQQPSLYSQIQDYYAQKPDFSQYIVPDKASTSTPEAEAEGAISKDIDKLHLDSNEYIPGTTYPLRKPEPQQDKGKGKEAAGEKK